MDWQQVSALGIVAFTAATFGFVAWRRNGGSPFARRSFPCGCAGGKAPGNLPNVVLRGRKGQRPQLIIRQRG